MKIKSPGVLLGFILIVSGFFASPPLSAANILKIGSYQVSPNTDFTIQLEAENSDPFVAFQADIPIPTGFSYIEGSAQLNGTRISGHSLSVSLVDGNILRLIGFSLSNTAFTGNSGSLVSFSLKSGSVPGTYALQIDQPMLGNSQSANILSSSTNGDATVLSPNIRTSVTEINFGRVPLGSTPELSFQVFNDGNRDLVISSLVFNDAQFTTTVANNFTISANSSRSIPVKFSPVAKGTFAKELKINSNDPDQPISTIALKAIAYAVNEIHTGNITGASSSTGKLDFTLNNMEEFTGFQFDLNLPLPMTFAAGTAELFRSVDHTVTVNQINAQTLRVLAFSANNNNFTGNNGKVLSLSFSLNGVAGNYSVGITNVLIANTLSENILSASTGGQLQITAPDIDAATQLNFGDVSILSDSTKQHRIYNFGQEPLIISQLLFSNDYFKSTQTVPFTIQPSGYLDIPVKFTKAVKGAATGTLRILSNDPDENPFTIQLSGNAFSPNYLRINPVSFYRGESKDLSVEIENEEPFVAFQFDLTYPAGFTPDLNAITLSSRKQDHVLAATALTSTSIRILAYSFSQKSFTGKSGAVLTIPCKADTTLLAGTYSLTFSNTLLSNLASENILYASINGALSILNLFSKQEISLAIGWNIISAFVMPVNPDLKTIFQSLIDAGMLKKVMDETGKTIENFGAFGGWKNNIGNLNSAKGYKVNVTAASTLSLEGAPVQLPLNLTLNIGWNIISYPCTASQDAKAIVQGLIDAGKLKKVMDETGKTIENFGAFGGWKNNIGNFLPGKGYKVNVLENCTLTIPASSNKSATILPEVLKSIHFTNVFKGNGTDHFNVHLVNLASSGLQAGDEIGIFDGKYCVGSATIGQEQLMNGSISMPASFGEDEQSGNINGFTVGHTLTLQLYRENQTYPLTPAKVSGSESFEKNGSLFLKVTASDLPAAKINVGSDQMSCYPNPFSNQLTIEIRLTRPKNLEVKIYDLSGKLVRSLFKGEAGTSETLVWDGTSGNGAMVGSGTYILKANEMIEKVALKK